MASYRRRQRDYAGEYARRKARAKDRGYSTSQARGHARSHEKPISAPEPVRIIGPEGPTDVELSSRERSRAARKMGDTGRLLAGDLPASTFDKRWNGRTFGEVVGLGAAETETLARGGYLDDYGHFYSRRAA